jgi:hypothetical protein
MNTYSWDCKTVDTYPSQDALADVVYNVHWRLNGTDESGEHSATVIGTQTVEVDPDNFTAFADLTNEMVAGWVQAAMGEERVTELMSSVDSQIADKVAPKTVTKTIGAVVETPVEADAPVDETAPAE